MTAKAEYFRMIERIRQTARATLPLGARVLVVSKGDPSLLDLAGPQGLHFPQDVHGDYVGYHPAGSTEALEHLEDLRARGAEYLLIPKTADWWLQHYRELAAYLDSRYRKVPVSSDCCRIFALSERADHREPEPLGRASEADQRDAQLEAFADSVLPTGAGVVVVGRRGLGNVRLGARRVHTLRLPEFEAPASEGAVAERLVAAIEGQADYVIVTSAEDPPDELWPGLFTWLRRVGRLVAYREQLGWLFDVSEGSPHLSGLRLTQGTARPGERGTAHEQGNATMIRELRRYDG